jgi:type IV pilus assembly protein PilC
MPHYAYRAINTNGRQLRGGLAAANERDLQQALGTLGLELIDCRPTTRRPGLWVRRGRVTSRDLLQLCVHLEQLQRAGVPLLDGLADVRDAAEGVRLRELCAAIHRDVSDGQPLSVACGRHPKLFGNVFTALIAAGEETGKLADSFRQLVRHLKWTAAMSARVRKATRYPAVAACVVVGVTVFMMAGVVPQVVDFLAANNQELPVWTVALIATSGVVQAWWPLLLGLPAVACALVRFLVQRSPRCAYRWDAFLLALPVFGEVMRKLALARFSQMFAVLFQSGIDILTCLDAGRRVTGNRVLGEALGLVRRQVQSGSPLSAALAASGAFPTRVTRMVRIGEETGRLSETLSQVAEFYEGDVDEAIDAMIALIEPALTAVLGLVMAWIALAVFGPIYDNLDQMGI